MRRVGSGRGPDRRSGRCGDAVRVLAAGAFVAVLRWRGARAVSATWLSSSIPRNGGRVWRVYPCHGAHPRAEGRPDGRGRCLEVAAELSGDPSLPATRAFRRPEPPVCRCRCGNNGRFGVMPLDDTVTQLPEQHLRDGIGAPSNARGRLVAGHTTSRRRRDRIACQRVRSCWLGNATAPDLSERPVSERPGGGARHVPAATLDCLARRGFATFRFAPSHKS
jgi:hypothetical protein